MVQRTKPSERGRIGINDTIVPQLALRVTSNGAKSYVVRTRLRGKQVRLTIGNARAINLKDAREEASEFLKMCRNGIDPREVRRAKKREEEAVEELRFDRVTEQFIERHAKRHNRTWKDTQAIFSLHVLPRWGDRQLTEITRADVSSLLDAVEDGSGVYRANRVLAAVRKLFNWAVERELMDFSPTAKVKARKGEKARTHYLSPDEIRLVWRASDRLGYPFGRLVQLLLATGQRRGEVAGMRWDQLDLEGERLWTLPPENTKADREHVVPLSDMALEVLNGPKGLPRLGKYALTTRGDRPVAGFSKGKRRLDAAALAITREEAEAAGRDLDEMTPLPVWRLHDLRRTVATHMAETLGFAPYIVGMVLNHDPKQHSGVTAIYTRGEAIDDRRRALNAWSRFLRLVLKEGAWTKVSEHLRAKEGENEEAAPTRRAEFRDMIQAGGEAWSEYVADLSTCCPEHFVKS
jgi:integrase